MKYYLLFYFFVHRKEIWNFRSTTKLTVEERVFISKDKLLYYCKIYTLVEIYVRLPFLVCIACMFIPYFSNRFLPFYFKQDILSSNAVSNYEASTSLHCGERKR
jgi:hypothetical protein